MANDRSNLFFNVLALENILVALTREIGDGPCFLYINFSWIGVVSDITDFTIVRFLLKIIIPFTMLISSSRILKYQGP